MAIPFGENGGFAITSYITLVPVQDAATGVCYFAIWDATNFDDPNDGSFYAYREEDVIVGRYPTVRRVILVYRDLGLASLVVTVSGTNDSNQVVSSSATVPLGNAIPTQELLTAFADIGISCYRPQLSLRRFPGGGPVSIISATLVGEVEQVDL
jgi:hypothetical protein